ncbi:restriction endonuclease subunit S [Pseudomonas sp. GT1P32]
MIQKKKLSSVAKISVGQTFREKAEAISDESGIRLIQIKDIREGALIDADELSFAEIDPAKIKAPLTFGDVLLPLRGNRSEAMLYNVKNSDILVVTTNQVAVIKSLDQGVGSAYFHWYLNSPFGRRALDSIRGGATIPNISIKNLSEIEIPIPSPEDQGMILQIYDSWCKQKSVLQELLVNGESLMASACMQVLGGGVK